MFNKYNEKLLIKKIERLKFMKFCAINVRLTVPRIINNDND